ncbi:MAG: hypothetical protein WBA93_19055 [Microcoleaceae cyanobacterium]
MGNWEIGKLGNWKLGNWEIGKLGNWAIATPLIGHFAIHLCPLFSGYLD